MAARSKRIKTGTRHFVSHGGKLQNSAVTSFISIKLGKQVNRFDPTDKSHMDFITLQNVSAHKFIKAELNKLIK